LPQLGWVLLTSAFLFLYVFSWYWGLKYVPVTVATCILSIGSVITLSLTLFTGATITLAQALGMLLIVLGIVVMVGWAAISKKLVHIFSTANP